jgi:hypothetical protein
MITGPGICTLHPSQLQLQTIMLDWQVALLTCTPSPSFITRIAAHLISEDNFISGYRFRFGPSLLTHTSQSSQAIAVGMCKEVILITQYHATTVAGAETAATTTTRLPSTVSRIGFDILPGLFHPSTTMGVPIQTNNELKLM